MRREISSKKSRKMRFSEKRPHNPFFMISPFLKPFFISFFICKFRTPISSTLASHLSLPFITSSHPNTRCTQCSALRLWTMYHTSPCLVEILQHGVLFCLYFSPTSEIYFLYFQYLIGLGRIHITSGLDPYAKCDFAPGYLDEWVGLL